MRKGISFQVVAEIISLGDRKLNKQASQAINKYISRLKELLTEGIRDGAVRQDIDLEASATLLFALIQGLVNIWSLSEGSFTADREVHLPLADLPRSHRHSLKSPAGFTFGNNFLPAGCVTSPIPTSASEIPVALKSFPARTHIPFLHKFCLTS